MLSSTYPQGWYAIGYSSELKPGALSVLHYFGRDLVLFRTDSGSTALVDAHCPHLGAHLGKGGKVIGESLRCPFHGLCFNSEGHCVSTAYGTKPPPKAKLKTWPLVEFCGFLCTYFDPAGEAPAWQLPSLNSHTYTPIRGGCWTLSSHPQEILENSVDFGHLSALHGFEISQKKAEVSEKDYILTVDASIERRGSLFARNTSYAIYKTFLYGLGISFVDVQIPVQGLKLRLFGMPTPIDPDTTDFRLAVQLHRIEDKKRIHPLFTLIPKRWIESLILQQAYRGYVSDVSKDFPIWQNKVYLDRPILASGDGPILRYRHWARQFYKVSHEHFSRTF